MSILMTVGFPFKHKPSIEGFLLFWPQTLNLGLDRTIWSMSEKNDSKL
jgi:hypothetical protein